MGGTRRPHPPAGWWEGWVEWVEWLLYEFEVANRSYEQACSVARALDVLGDRWTLCVLRDLGLGPLRFGELLELESGIGPNLLTQRLKQLRARGLVYSEPLPYPAKGRGYALTALGHTVEPVLRALAAWGDRMPAEEGHRAHPDWAMRRLPERFQRASHPGTARIRLPARAYVLEWTTARLSVARKDTDRFDVEVEGSQDALLAWLEGQSTAPWQARGRWRVQGDPASWSTLEAACGLGNARSR